MPKAKKNSAPISPPKAKEQEWAKKVEIAMQVRETSAEAQKGQPMSFPTGMRKQ